MKKYIFLSFITLSISTILSAQAITVPLRFDHYYDYAQVVEALKALNKAYPAMTSLDLVGKSEENREIWALTINDPSSGKAENKTGIYVDGNIHGNEIQAGEVCLYLANMLLTEYGKKDEIKKALEHNVFYILPVVNVDGRYHFFADPNNPNSNRSLRIPMDDDHDGLVDEDGYDDIDGDGNICSMRIKDPNGDYKTDPLEPRLMVRVKPGEKGEYRLLGSEGIDNDGDGQFNEDAPGYVDGNRNWGYNWVPDYVESGAGYYPFQGKGIAAIRDYIVARPNILMVFAFHNNGGMYLRGPSTKAEGELNPNDIRVYDYIGQNAEKIVPGYRYLVSWKDLYPTYGDFTEFTYNVCGAFGFVGELYQTETETYESPEERAESSKDESSASGQRGRDSEEYQKAQRERLKFNDYLAQGTLYKNWTPAKHPVFGDIEIGGWVKMSTRLPSLFMLPDLIHRNASAVLFTALQTPKPAMEIFDKTKLSGDLYRIRVRITNGGVMPTMASIAIQKKLYPMDQLHIESKGGKVIAGGVLNNAYTDEVSYKKSRADLQFLSVPGNGKEEYQFLVSGKGPYQITYTSQKAGSLSETVSF